MLFAIIAVMSSQQRLRCFSSSEEYEQEISFSIDVLGIAAGECKGRVWNKDHFTLHFSSTIITWGGEK